MIFSIFHYSDLTHLIHNFGYGPNKKVNGGGGILKHILKSEP